MHWDRVFALRPHLTHIDLCSYTTATGDVERYLDVYDDEHETPLGIRAIRTGSALKDLLYECWEIDHPDDFEPVIDLNAVQQLPLRPDHA